MAKQVRVVVSNDCPPMVTGGPPLSQADHRLDAEGWSERWLEGETSTARESYALCRCGPLPAIGKNEV
jgi:CDGSH-type Zn-finger protein